MAKVNRRDYLRWFGVGAAAIVGLRLEVFAHGPRIAKEREEAEIEPFDPLVEYFQTWPETDVPPDPNPRVLVTFHGLLDFYYNSSGSNKGILGVGFPKGNGNHSRMVEIFENGNPQPTRSIPISNKEVKLGIVKNPNQPLSPLVKFFKKAGRDDDFRWLIDLQSRPWYKGVLTSKQPEYAARLFVRQGTFFTKKRTKFLLDQVTRVEVGSVSHIKRADLGKPGEVIGGAVNLEANHKVLLNVNGSDVPLPYDASKKYEIRFSHLCPHHSAGDPCHFDPQHFQEVKRNDFHHHRDALDLPGFSEKYTVVVAPGQVSTESNDSAPCMGAGYGGGNGPA
jgi:hypothetical protein